MITWFIFISLYLIIMYPYYGEFIISSKKNKSYSLTSLPLTRRNISLWHQTDIRIIMTKC